MNTRVSNTISGTFIALAAFVIVSPLTLAQSTMTDSEAANRINAANTLLRDGKIDDAIQGYHEVVPGDQQKDQLNYNLAVAEYRTGNITAAEQLFTEVAGSGRPAIFSDSRYNLGNCQYADAIQLAEKDKSAAIERLRQAVSNYRGSLRGNPANSDARANIELAGELIRKLEQEQKKQDQDQSPDQDKKDKSDQEKSEEQKSEQPQKDRQHQSKQSKDEQKDGKSENQQSPEDQGKPEEQEAKHQPVPDGELKSAGDQEENRKPGGSAAKANPKAKDGLMTREEALKMLQAVRDRDMLRRMQQQRQERSRHVSVERDW